MITADVARKRIQESLVGFPPQVVNDYLAFAESADLARLDATILGVLQFYLAKKSPTPIQTLPGTTRLVQDLGCDSLAMMDMVFMVEGLFDIKVDDAELAKTETLDDLRGYVRKCVSASQTAPAK